MSFWYYCLDKIPTKLFLDFCPEFFFVASWGLFGSTVFLSGSKGQLISKCPFGIIVWTKIPTKLFLDFCPEFFCSFLGASWKLFGLPGDLVFNIINKEAYRKPQKASRKPPGRFKKISGQKSRNNFVVIFVQTMKPKGRFKIN